VFLFMVDILSQAMCHIQLRFRLVLMLSITRIFKEVAVRLSTINRNWNSIMLEEKYLQPQFMNYVSHNRLILFYFCKYFNIIIGSYSILTFNYSLVSDVIVLRKSPMGSYISKLLSYQDVFKVNRFLRRPKYIYYNGQTEAPALTRDLLPFPANITAYCR
jgi:hypothetical protein